MLSAIKGFHDILPGEVEKWQFIETKARKIFEDFGFSEIKTPIIEKTELFTRGIGEATDVVEKEMFTFTDRKGEYITLRPEATASIARAYIENRLDKNGDVKKLYCIGPMFRYERPQKGRYRQFHQINAEVLGTTDPAIDAEIMAMLKHFLLDIDITGISLQINSLGCSECRDQYREVLRSFLIDNLMDLCADCQRRIDVNPLRSLDCKRQTCKEATSVAPEISDYICSDCSEDFRDVKTNLEQLQVPYEINPRLVRGLDYYTKTTFEAITNRLGAQNAVAAGGRYDGLIKNLGGPDIPGLGFAIGLERLISLIPQEREFSNPLYLFIATLGDAAKRKALQLANGLRIMGIKTEMGYGSKSLKSQMRSANKMNAGFVLIIGDNELSLGKVILRDMVNKTQEEISVDRVIEEIASRKKRDTDTL